MPKKRKIRVYLADDHEIIRAGMRSLLHRECCFQVVGEAGTVNGALAGCMKDRPDVVVLDLYLGTQSGLTVCKWIKSMHPQVGVLILSAYVDSALVYSALRAGADGYMLKEVDHAGFCDAVRRVGSGAYAFCDAALACLVKQARGEGRRSIASSLSFKEKQIVSGMAEGLLNKEIAARMKLSEKTVRNYASRIFKKTNVAGRHQLIACYLRQSLRVRV